MEATVTVPAAPAPSKEELLLEIADMAVADMIHANKEATQNLIDVYQMMQKKRKEDKEKFENEKRRMEILGSQLYISRMRNTFVETYSILSYDHVKKMYDGMLFQAAMQNADADLYVRTKAITEGMLDGTFEPETTH